MKRGCHTSQPHLRWTCSRAALNTLKEPAPCSCVLLGAPCHLRHLQQQRTSSSQRRVAAAGLLIKLPYNAGPSKPFGLVTCGHLLCCICAATAAAADDGICPDKAGLAVQLIEMLGPPKITKTDEAFAADGVEFVYNHEGIDLEELNELFGKVSHKAHALLMHHSSCKSPCVLSNCSAHVSSTPSHSMS